MGSQYITAQSNWSWRSVCSLRSLNNWSGVRIPTFVNGKRSLISPNLLLIGAPGARRLITAVDGEYLGISQEKKDITAPNTRLVSYDKFVRSNPKSDRFKVNRFHHVEFWCNDATNTSCRFSYGLGMPLVAKSDLSTGNFVHASYLLRSGDLNLLFTAPYSATISSSSSATTTASIPTFDPTVCSTFVTSHGLGIRAIALEVEDAKAAFDASVAAGALPSSPPILLDDGILLAEVQLYGDVVLRYVSHAMSTSPDVDDGKSTLPPCCFLPKFVWVEAPNSESSFNMRKDLNNISETQRQPCPNPKNLLGFGIRGLDHATGNAPQLGPVVEYIKNFTGFHEFAEFGKEDLTNSSTESGLQSVVLANNNESVILSVNEPVYGTKRKSPIQTFLDHNEGPGVQHLALITDDIFKTLRQMKERGGPTGMGFEFMPSPPREYYESLKAWAGDKLTEKQLEECEELGIKVDKDDEGVLLQRFTTPVGDRPTFFLEIIQRIGCMVEDDDGKVYQKGGCGGFGKGNISELFKSIEEYEKSLEAIR